MLTEQKIPDWLVRLKEIRDKISRIGRSGKFEDKLNQERNMGDATLSMTLSERHPTPTVGILGEGQWNHGKN